MESNAIERGSRGATVAGPISAQERELLIDLLLASRDLFVESIAQVSRESWQWRPKAGSWSVAECAEHVVLSERALRQIVIGLVASSAPAPSRAAAVQGKDGFVVQAMRDQTRRTKTPPFLEPTGRWPERGALLDRFLAERMATLQYVRITCDPLHRHVATFESLGDLDAYQWLLLLASHTERHVAQIAATVAAGQSPHLNGERLS